MNDWNLSPDPATTERIIKQCYELEPSLSFDGSGPGSIPIIKVNVGLRPARKGGARLERETITVPFRPQAYKPLGSNVTADLKPRQVDVIHAYGIGGMGFQVGQCATVLFSGVLTEVNFSPAGGWQRTCYN